MNELNLPKEAQHALEKAQHCVQKKDYGQAHKIFRSLLQVYPHNGQIHLVLGELYSVVEEFDLAISHLSQACQRMPQDYRPIFSLMDTFEAVNAHADVTTLNDFMLVQFRQSPEVLYKAALHCSETGQFTKAKEYCKRCIALCESSSKMVQLLAYAWLLILKLDASMHCSSSAVQLIKLLESQPKHSPQAMLLHYGIGEVFHHLGQTEKAFMQWQQANNIQRMQANFDTQELATFFGQIKSVHSPFTQHNKRLEHNNNANVEGPILIFIIGLPRTGSTLLETLLSKHSAIESVAETTIISEQLARYFTQHFKQPYPLFMSTLLQDSSENDTLLKNARAIYDSAIKKRQLTAPYIIDKLPANFQSIGLIKRVFPDAKIIHLSRNFDDVALSIFRHHFASNEPYFCDLSQLNVYHGFYQSLMAFWHKAFGSEIYRLHYEDLVQQPETLISQVLSYCDLEFEQACIYRQAADPAHTVQDLHIKPIKTLSAVQVRAPISNLSVGNAKPYKAMMNECLKGSTD